MSCFYIVIDTGFKQNNWAEVYLCANLVILLRLVVVLIEVKWSYSSINVALLPAYIYASFNIYGELVAKSMFITVSCARIAKLETVKAFDLL